MRTRVILILAIGVLVSAGARAAGAADLEKELVIVTSGGTFEQAFRQHFYEPFTKETRVTVRTVATTLAEAMARVKAMAQTGNVEWDIVSTGDASAAVNREQLLILDCAAIPNAAAQGVSGACKENRLLRTIGGIVIAYSTRAFPAGKRPKSWADFWDVQRFPGPRAMINQWTVLVAALLADGVPADRLFPMDLDRAFRKMDEIKPHVRVWWKTGDQSQQIMRDGEVVLNAMWSGRAQQLKAAGVPVDVEWNQALKDVAYWSVVKGAPHPKAAYAFLNYFMGRPEAHLAFSRQMFYDTSNRLALDLVPPAERPARATFLANWQAMVDVEGHPWVIENTPRIVERWNSWLAR